MMGDLGKSQLSSLLEAVPGLASVLRSPVADAIVNMVRAGAGLRDFDIHEAEELVQYATRRGLIPSAEGAQLLDEVKVPSRKVGANKRGPKSTVAKTPKAKSQTKKSAAKEVKAKSPTKKSAAKKVKAKSTSKKPVAKKKAGKKTAGRASKGRR